jgi:hypothetical protein
MTFLETNATYLFDDSFPVEQRLISTIIDISSLYEVPEEQLS